MRTVVEGQSPPPTGPRLVMGGDPFNADVIWMGKTAERTIDFGK